MAIQSTEFGQGRGTQPIPMSSTIILTPAPESVKVNTAAVVLVECNTITLCDSLYRDLNLALPLVAIAPFVPRMVNTA